MLLLLELLALLIARELLACITCQLLVTRDLARRPEYSYRIPDCTDPGHKHSRSQLARTGCSPADHRIESSSLAVAGFRRSLAGTEVVRNRHRKPVLVGKKLHQV